ncbi:MAG TPA: SRPBCC family protein [Acidimicrobiales bacterium]|nr:SRPBCC family protein [Acidimicrobiales bacterium]
MVCEAWGGHQRLMPLAGDALACRHRGAPRPLVRPPLMVVAGAAASGRSTRCQRLAGMVAGGPGDGAERVDGGKMPAMSSERIEVPRIIPTDPATIFAVLADPQGHVAIDSSGMLMDATGDPVTAVGDTFVVHMDRESLNDYPLGLYDVTVQIVAFEQDREIAWTIVGQIKPQIGHVYGYTLEPADGGTLVTSYYDWSDIDPQWKEANIFPVVPESALRATLGILARTVARGVPRPQA